jgi:hypothetical protein
MQEASEEADASVPAEPVPDGPPSSGGTVMLQYVEKLQSAAFLGTWQQES